MPKIKGLRWWMINLIMLRSIVNYLTRSTLAVAAPAVLSDLHITEKECVKLRRWTKFSGSSTPDVSCAPPAGFLRVRTAQPTVDRVKPPFVKPS